MNDLALIEESALRTINTGLTQEIIETSERGVWPAALWELIAAQGLLHPAALAAGGDPGEGLAIEAAVIRAAAAAAAPLPVAETALAGWFLARAGIEPPAGPLTLPACAAGDFLTLADGRVTGVLERVPWGRDVVGVVAVAGGALVLLDARTAPVTLGLNVAGEPRDALRFTASVPLARAGALEADALLRRAAAARATQLAAAAARALEITVGYATQRQQFGRLIGSFQAIQHQLAAVASEVASAQVAARQAYFALAAGKNELFACAVAKARASDAAGAVARVAQQVHGAIGYTREYQLQRFTRRISAWRGEYGSAAFWSRHLGELILRERDRSLWSIVTSGI